MSVTEPEPTQPPRFRSGGFGSAPATSFASGTAATSATTSVPTQGWGASSSAPSTSSSRQLPRPSPRARGRFQPARPVAARPAQRPDVNQPAPVRGERSRPYPRRRGGRQPRSEPRPHPLVNRHPWASLVRLRRLRLAELSSDQVTSDLPADQYRQIPVAGYLSIKFCRSLFPRVAPRNGVVHGTISCVELPSLEDAVLFREAAERLIQDSIAGSLDPLPRPPAEALSPKDRRGVAEHGSMGSRRHEQSGTPTGGDNGRCDLGELVSKERFALLCGV
ncbi:hypothetical protein Q1695_004347 [Nippostrongylus brasiliensis]|nr:hypothetical protein Q1695_004347 [Nippostrongylus brasiliensis]